MLNPLSYTSLTPSTCEETIHVPMGHVCSTSTTIRKLEINKDKILGDPQTYKNNPIISNPENIPTDGSKNSKTILDYMKGLNVLTEYDVITHPKVKTLLGKKTIEKELERFKVPADRYIIRGSCMEDTYDVLVRWSNLFKFFKPLTSDEFTPENIFKIFSNNTNIKVIAVVVSISTTVLDEEEGGFHAVSMLIDRRSDIDWTVEYFDSSGGPPHDQHIKLMFDISKKISKLTQANVEQIAVTKRLIHQHTTAECGILSLIFIRRRLEGITYNMFSHATVPPNFAVSFRKFVFSA